MKSQKRIDAFDLSKMILSFLVITIHIPLLENYLNPLARVAVPVFFMISSYLFFNKVKDLPGKQGLNVLKHFLLRNARLYAFWFVVLLPITIRLRNYLSYGLIQGLGILLHDFLCYSTFRASWYIVALCITVSLIYLMSKKLPNTVLLIISAAFFCFFCLYSNYYGLISGFPALVSFGEAYEDFFITICNSFPIGFLWVVLGKLFAEGSIHLKRNTAVPLLIISFITLYAEQFIVLFFHLNRKNDCYFSLVPLCIALFSILYSSNLSLKRSREMRVISTITYVLHSSALSPIEMLLNRIPFLHGEMKNFAAFLIDVVLCVSISIVIMILEKHKGFRWLKWSH